MTSGRLHRNDDILYYGGTEEMTATAQRKFVEHFIGVPGRVLEVGCGKGVMLELLKAKNVSAYGIDTSASSVEYCRSKGLEAIHEDVHTHLEKLPPESLGGIFCAHVIEHMQPAEAIRFIHESFRVVKKRGRVVVITPNAKDLRTAERFWFDITHVRPYPEKLLRYLFQSEGFGRIYSTTDAEPVNNVFERIAKTLLRLWFMGYMFTGDLAVIAEK